MKYCPELVSQQNRLQYFFLLRSRRLQILAHAYLQLSAASRCDSLFGYSHLKLELSLPSRLLIIQ